MRIQEGELIQKMAPIKQTRTRSGGHWTLGFPSVYRSPTGGKKPFDADGAEDTAKGDAIMVGVVGSAAPGSSQDGRTMLKWSS